MKNKMRRTCGLWLMAAIFTGVFGAVYETFSHQVYSGFMVYAFLIPLVGGFMPYAFFIGKMGLPGNDSVPLMLYNSGIVTLTSFDESENARFPIFVTPSSIFTLTPDSAVDALHGK